jgi:hypothetical protein
LKKNYQKNEENLDNSGYESGEIIKNSSSDKEEDENSNSSEDAMSLDSDENYNKKSFSLPISIQDIQKILIKRKFIEKNYDLPMFDSSIKDSFVKINIGGNRSSKETYSLGQVKNVFDIPDKPYNFMGKMITKYLSVLHPSSKGNVRLIVISNSDLTKEEFEKWYNNMEKVIE